MPAQALALKPRSPAARAPLSLWIDPEPCAPPPAAVIAAVLGFGDLREEQDDGTVIVRFSPARVEREDLRLLLGADRRRALDVSIVCDEAQAEVLRVIDLAPLRPPPGPRSRNRYAEARMRSMELQGALAA